MFRMLRFCSDSVQSMLRIFSNVQTLFNLVNVQNVQNLFRIFSQCSEFSIMFKLCSVNEQNVQNLFRIFSQCSEFSVMFRLCSEYLAQKLVCSEFLDFVVHLFRYCSLERDVWNGSLASLFAHTSSSHITISLIQFGWQRPRLQLTDHLNHQLTWFLHKQLSALNLLKKKQKKQKNLFCLFFSR
jgi:hypothetical protein